MTAAPLFCEDFLKRAKSRHSSAAIVISNRWTRVCRSYLQDGASSMIRIILTVCAAFTLWASSATAQTTLAVGPCTADEMKLCSGIKPGRESLRACFRAHIHELSDACLLSLARLTAVDKTCRERLNRECASVEPGAGRLEACLRSAATKLSDACKRALARAIPAPR